MRLMEDEINAPWWHGPLRGIAMFLGLLAMSGLLMGLIIGVARFLDTGERGGMTHSQPTYSNDEAPKTEEKNARTHVPSSYDPSPWPRRPNEPAAFGGRISRIGNSGGGKGGGSSSGSSGGASGSGDEYSGPVGLSVDEYKAAVASGKPLFIPNPKGECDLGANASVRELENCFAERVAR